MKRQRMESAKANHISLAKSSHGQQPVDADDLAYDQKVLQPNSNRRPSDLRITTQGGAKSMNAPLDLGDAFMLGPDRVDTISHRVTAPDGSSFEMSMTAMQLLVALAKRPGEIVSIEALLEEIWGTTAESLERARAEVAHDFGDEQRSDPRYILAFPGQGYQLLQTVRPGAVPFNAKHSRLFVLELGRRKVFRAAGAYCLIAFVLLQISDATFDALRFPSEAVPALLIALVVGFPVVVLLAWFLEITRSGVERDAESGWFRRMGRRWEVAALMSLFVLSLVFASIISSAVDWSRIGAVPDLGIAVLRIQNHTGKPANDHLAASLTETVTNELAIAGGYSVSALTDASRYPDGKTGTREIARQLDVDFVVEGSLVEFGDTPQLFVQLIDGDTGKHRWSDRFAISDWLAIGGVVVGALAEEFGSRSDHTPEDSVVSSAPGMVEDLEQVAARYFESNQLDLASQVWQQALAIEPTASVYYSLGRLHYLQRDYASAIAVLRSAVDEFPENDAIWGALGFSYVYGAGPESAEAALAFSQAEQLARRDADDLPTSARLGAYLANLGRFGEAAAVASNLLNVNSSNPDVHYWSALALAKIGDERRTTSAIKTALAHGLAAALVTHDPDLAPYTPALP